MHSPLAIYLLGLPKITVSFPLLNSPYFSILISTRNKNIKIDNSADSTVPHNFDFVQNVLQGKNYEKTYTSNFTGDQLVQLLGGQKDVYSLQLQAYNDSGTFLNIQDWGKFINQFVQLFSLVFRINTHTNSVIKGNLADIPDSVERIRLNFLTLSNATDFYLNFSGFKSTSKLKYFFQENNSFLINGDLSNLPPLVNFFKVTTLVSGSQITYTAGKVWASSFDTLNIPLALATAELDNMLIDMDNSITTKIGAGVISLGGYRSSASDSAVASLQAKGFTVNVARHDVFQRVLDLPFQNSFADSGEMAMTMVAGGTSNAPTFALSGRKAGEYCAVFNGSQSIKTTANLPINSDKVTVAFWIKTTQSATAIISETTTDYSVNNAFAILMRAAVKVDMSDRVSAVNRATTSSLSNSWKHIVISTDRALGIYQTKIYVDGVLDTTLDPSYRADNNGNFVNNILYIGQRGGSSLGFNGSLTKLKIYNYPLTAGEVSTLYNSEL